MRLSAKVVKLEDFSLYTDKKYRITLQVREAEATYREIKIAADSLDGILLGDIHDLVLEGLFPGVTCGETH